MATADVDTTVTSDSMQLFFCHSCRKEMIPKLPDYTCSVCDSGFIEEIEKKMNPNADEEDTAAESFANEWQNMYFDHMGPGRGRRRRPGHHFHIRNHGPQVLFQFGTGGGSPSSSLHMLSENSTNSPIDTFIQQLFSNLGVQIMQPGVGGINFGNGTMGDYAWGPNGLDNIITQLLNQVESTGPPPADKSKIQSIPVDRIGAKEIEDKMECAVCRDEYILDELVKRLPCAHIFHPACVDPWLELHDSCPVCRCNLNGETPVEKL